MADLSLKFVELSETAAIAAAKWIGRGDKKSADAAAVDAMRKAFNNIDINGTVVIGEGERDKAPMLFIGEKVGNKNGPEIDIAVDPLECTNNVAKNLPNSFSVLAVAQKGKILRAPDVYMNKIAVGPLAAGKVSLEGDVKYNLENLSKALDKQIKDLKVVVLDRERHQKLISEIKEAGAQVVLITDGDVLGAISPSIPRLSVDCLMGIGAAPEGVLAATALSCLGGYIEGKFVFKDEGEKIAYTNEQDKEFATRSTEEKERTRQMGTKKIDEILKMEDMTDTKNSLFIATGVTGGDFLRGVEFLKGSIKTHSVLMNAKNQKIQFIETINKGELNE